MKSTPKPQEIYRHFKGNIYQILTLAEHSETGESMVVYQALYGDYKVYVRPLDMFLEKVDRSKYPDVKQEYRFERLNTGWSAEITGADACANTPAGIMNPDFVVDTASGQASAADALPVSEAVQESSAQESPVIDALVLDFLDADTYGEKLRILAALHHRITDQMITTMAIASDIEINDGDLESRYEALRNCLQTLEKYECSRLR